MDKAQIATHVEQIMADETKEQTTRTVALIEERPDEENTVGGQEPEVIEGEVVENPPEPKLPFYQRRISPKWLFVFALSVALLIALGLLFLLPIFMLTATVIIVPTEKQFSTNLTVQLPSTQVFSPLTVSETKTIATTGKGHQNATQAQGTATFYNAAPYAQTVYAGTLLIGSDGAHIITDQTAIIPGANAPIEGEVTVRATAISTGSVGNIAAFDINGACCRENIFVKNLAPFTGGANTRDFMVATKSDIASISATINTDITQRMANSFTSQLHPNEALAPPLCSQIVTSDHKVGEEATQVTVTVQKTCSDAAYNKHALQVAIQESFLREAANRFQVSYQLSGKVQTSLLQILDQHEKVMFTLRAKAALVYQFRQAEKKALLSLIAGKDKAQVLKMLSNQAGIQQVNITFSSSATSLPQNPANIRIVVLQRGN